MIQLDSITARRGGRDVLNSITCRFPIAQTTAILGRSGSGKSTLLRLINRLLTPTTGRVLCNDRDVQDWDPFELRRSIGLVPQGLGLFPHWTAHRQIARFGGTPALAASLGLKPALLNRYPDQLSGGERQRVALARALAGNPPILMMDEPFSALDPIVRRDLQDLILSLGKTILFVTHDLREALRVSQRIVFLKDGKLVFDGTKEDFASCRDEEVQAYFRTLES